MDEKEIFVKNVTLLNQKLITTQKSEIIMGGCSSFTKQIH